MSYSFYRVKRNRMIAGIMAGLADKFKIDLILLRFLYTLFSILTVFPGFLIYIILAFILPYKKEEDDEDNHDEYDVGSDSRTRNRREVEEVTNRDC